MCLLRRRLELVVEINTQYPPESSQHQYRGEKINIEEECNERRGAIFLVPVVCFPVVGQASGGQKYSDVCEPLKHRHRLRASNPKEECRFTSPDQRHPVS